MSRAFVIIDPKFRVISSKLCDGSAFSLSFLKIFSVSHQSFFVKFLVYLFVMVLFLLIFGSFNLIFAIIGRWSDEL